MGMRVELGKCSAVLPVGLLPVLLLALPATVVEDLAPCASKRHPVLLLLFPSVHQAVGADVLQGSSKKTITRLHPVSALVKGRVVLGTKTYPMSWKQWAAATRRRVCTARRKPPRSRRELYRSRDRLIVPFHNCTNVQTIHIYMSYN